ncbi:hypothetical protein M9H77_36011 [Catharanthus roseus]|uniref:Uncharacterized protein n=1 Tax=Catharanthus roseus TaxID=4058 RepID=A0ACB9ZT67_CATRO|nr:hypothetical protein M9H77_36011 [Catharanthus roseus]
MGKPVNASNNKCLKSLSWGPSKCERGSGSLTCNCGYGGFYTSRDIYSFYTGFCTPDNLGSIFAAAILESGAHVYSFGFILCGDVIDAYPFIIACPLAPAPSSTPSPAPPFESVVDSCILILLIVDSMMRCLRRPIGPHPPRSTPLLKWIHPQS